MALLTSSPTTVAVVSAATPLFEAARSTSTNSFGSFSGSGLTTRVSHPITANPVSVLEDGRLSQGYQTLGYSGKGAFDPISRQVIWSSTGAGSNYAGGHAHNTQARFSEASNSWSANRAFKGANDPTSRTGLVHIYDSNCIDVAGRRAYKKWFSNEILVYGIDSNSFLNNIPGPTGHSSSFSWDAMDVVPTRGAAGALWLLGWSTANNIQVWEYDLAAGRWSLLINAAALGNQGTPSLGAPVLSYNPRAFGAAGGVMIGNESRAWTVNCATLAVTSVDVPPSGSIQIAHNGGFNSGFCRDPAGTGWLQFSDLKKTVYRWNGSQWETRAAMPAGFGGAPRNFIVVPIDTYGVVWLICYESGSGWLYRP